MLLQRSRRKQPDSCNWSVLETYNSPFVEIIAVVCHYYIRIKCYKKIQGERKTSISEMYTSAGQSPARVITYLDTIFRSFNAFITDILVSNKPGYTIIKPDSDASCFTGTASIIKMSPDLRK